MINIIDRVLSYQTNNHILSLGWQSQRISLSSHAPFNATKLQRVLRIVALGFAMMKETLGMLFEPLVNRLFWEQRKVRFLKQVDEDIRAFQNVDLMDRVTAAIENIIKSEHLDFGDNRRTVCDIAKAVYATTYSQYAPVAIEWARSLLARGKEHGAHIVFVARDGLAAYNAAQIIKDARGEELSAVGVSYVYLSRRIVEGPREKLKAYLQDQPFYKDAVEQKKKLLFCDIGFYGQIIPGVRKALSEIGIASDPLALDNQVYFEFLISISKIPGFAGNLASMPPAVTSTGGNRAVFWMEDTNHGVIESPTELIESEAGHYLPDTVVRCKTNKSRNSLDFLCNLVAQNALKDRTEEFVSTMSKGETVCLLEEGMRGNFDRFLLDWKTKRFSYFDHL